nr:helix-turn-helix transcriptional regulator [Actinokineospora terrae]
MAPPRSPLARLRKAAGYTQESLAAQLHVDRMTVYRWEAGRNEPQPYLWPKLAMLLGINRSELQGLFPSSPTSSAPPLETLPSQAPLVLSALRRMLAGGQADTISPGVAVTPLVKRVHQLYQHADYEASARLLPQLLLQLDNQAPSRTAAVWTASGYIAAAKLATKLGDVQAAWVTADRAQRAAREAEAPALIAAARYQVACAHLRSGHLTDAQDTAAAALDELATAVQKEDGRLILSARGALLLLSAVMAARSNEHHSARQLLSQAHQLADDLGGEGNWLWTGFGHTNVAIHELSVAVQLRDNDQAQQLGAALDTDRLPVVLIGRRSQVHLDLSRAATDRQDDSVAVLHLLEAERVAKQAVSRNVGAHEVIRTLLGREQRHSTPGLRALAQRAGIHV